VRAPAHSDRLAVYLLVSVNTVRRRISIRILGEEIVGERSCMWEDVKGVKPAEGMKRRAGRRWRQERCLRVDRDLCV
jgi:hypothetical protein